MKLYIDSLETEKEELKYKNKLKSIKIDQLSQKLNNLKNTDDEQSLIIIRQEETSLMNSSQDTKTENEGNANFGRFRRFEEEIFNLKKNIQKYEEQNTNLSNNIKKLREQYNIKLNEIKELENKYKRENKLLKKQLLISENKIKQLNDINNSNLNYNVKNFQLKKSDIFKKNKNSSSMQLLNDIESNHSIHKISGNKEKDDLSFLLNKTTNIRKREGSSLSATSSLDRIEKYLKRKYSTLKSQKTQKTSSVLKLRKKEKNNSMIDKKKTEDLIKLFLNDSNNHKNLTDRIRSSRIVQKSDDNTAYYNQYCNKKNQNEKKNIFKEIKISNLSSIAKKTRVNLIKKSNLKNNNLFEMINNINNINIFANNIKQNNNNMYYKSINNNNNSSFCNNYKNDLSKQFNNSTYNLHGKKKSNH